MSWSSLFAFSNPNGRIGSTYTAVPTYMNYAILNGNQNLATFTSLPIGIYSVQVSIPIINESYPFYPNPTIFNNWLIGASINNITSSIELGSMSAVGFPTSSVSLPSPTTISTTIIVNFILNNTDGTSPIYIKSVASIIISPGFVFNSNENNLVIATKLA